MFVVSADSVGPFDSHVGTLALLNLIVRRGRRIAPELGARPPGRGRGGVDAARLADRLGVAASFASRR